jgi:hypothetical protein
MKTIIIILLMIVGLATTEAQTINPSCYSNADGWKITKIENGYDGTYVYLFYYSYKTNYNFWINPGMYIENDKNPNTVKYRLVSFVDNQVNTKYSLNPFTGYNFILKFEKIPSHWTDINLIEPYTQGSFPWYWKNITLNLPESNRLKKDNFLVYDVLPFLNSFVHPTNTLQTYTYSVDYNEIRVVLYYEGYHTDLKIHFADKLISNIEVMSDNDFIYPFSALSLLKDYLLSQSNEQEYVSRFEVYLHKAFSSMNGRDIASIILTMMWNIRN